MNNLPILIMACLSVYYFFKDHSWECIVCTFGWFVMTAIKIIVDKNYS